MANTYTKIAASVLAFTLPATTIAAMLHADTSIAGLGLDMVFNGGKASTPFTITVEDPHGARLSLPAQTNERGEATAVLSGTKTETAGTYTISAIQGQETTGPVQVQVDADTMDARTSSIETRTPYIRADGRSQAQIMVTLRDQYGNPLADHPVSVISSRAEDDVQALSTQTDDDGTQHFALTTITPGTIQLRAIDLLSGNTINGSVSIQAESTAMGGYETSYNTYNSYTAPSYGGSKQFYPVQTETSNSTQPYNSYNAYTAQLNAPFGVLDRLEVTIASLQVNVNEEIPKFTVRAVDSNGNTVLDYKGKITFITTDPQAIVPGFGSFQFTDRDQGKKDFFLALKFRTPGPQTLRVADANAPDQIFGEAMVTVGGGGGGARGNITVTSQKNDDAVSTTDLLIAGIGPRYANIKIIGGMQDVTVGTDASGNFTATIKLNAAQRDHTIRVMDDTGLNDSGPIHLILDQSVPTIGMIQFTPEKPEQGDKVLVMVQSEPNLQEVTFTIPDPVNGQGVPLKLVASAAMSGSYQGFFTAPQSGLYQPFITIKDKAGNTQEARTQLNIGSKSLPIVQNVKAEPSVDSIELSWDAVGGEVTGYRVYVGTEPDNYIYSLDTGRVITKATVKGLTAGETYSFAVTALRGELESEDKSDAVEAQVLGFKLEVEPEDSALHVTWTSLTTDLPLSSFLLEYGTDQSKLTESRMLNSELRDYTIRDLLPGVTYFIKVTPITVTTDTLDELSATGEGTPAGAGFKPSPRDDVPFDIIKNPGGTQHSAPNVPNNGLPPMGWIAAIGLGILGVFYMLYRRSQISKTQAFLQAVQSQYRG